MLLALVGQASYGEGRVTNGQKTLDEDRMTEPMAPADILIVSAHMPELSGLEMVLGEDLEKALGAIQVVARPVGIGLPLAALGVADAMRRYAPRAVVMVGTCGAYLGRGLSIGDVVVGRRLQLVSAAAVEGRGAFPGPMSVVAEGDRSFFQIFVRSGAKEVDIATTLSITTDDDLAGRIANAHGCDVEHLEAFAVALACAPLRLPVATVLGVANMVGATGRDEWQKHHREVGSRATALVVRWLDQGAPGLEEVTPRRR
jgi:nucleoside phosphorylase